MLKLERGFGHDEIGICRFKTTQKLKIGPPPKRKKGVEVKKRRREY